MGKTRHKTQKSTLEIEIKTAIENNNFSELNKTLGLLLKDHHCFDYLAKLMAEDPALGTSVLIVIFKDPELSRKCLHLPAPPTCWNSLQVLHYIMCHAMMRKVGVLSEINPLFFLVKDDKLIECLLGTLLIPALTDKQACIRLFQGNLKSLTYIQAMFQLNEPRSNYTNRRVVADKIYTQIIDDRDIFWSLIKTIDDLKEFCDAFSKDKAYDHNDGQTFQHNYARRAIKRVLLNLQQFGPLERKDRLTLIELMAQYDITSDKADEQFILTVQAELKSKKTSVSVVSQSVFKQDAEIESQQPTNEEESMRVALQSSHKK